MGTKDRLRRIGYDDYGEGSLTNWTFQIEEDEDCDGNHWFDIKVTAAAPTLAELANELTLVAGEVGSHG